MKKLFLMFINVTVLLAVGLFIYNSYLNELNSKLTLDCSYNYTAFSNVMSVTCNVEDEDLIISDEHPLTFSLKNSSGIEIFVEQLENGSNMIEFDSLDYNSIFAVSVTGYDFIAEQFIQTIFEEFQFSTVRESIVVPTWTFTEILLLDTEYHFSIDILDLENRIESIDVILYNSSDEEILAQNFTDNDTLDLTLNELETESVYYIGININYVINDYNELETIFIYKEFTTLNLVLEPVAEITNVINNNVTLTFDLTTDDKGASNVVYQVELIDLLGNILYSEIKTESNISIDVVGISGNYFISVKASYLYMLTNYEDIELDTFNVYESALSNFFLIPTLNVVNTDLPLTNYNDYDDYVYTYFNQGITDFTIYCEGPVDCTELVNNDLYSETPLEVTDFIHAYFDVSLIGYVFSETELTFSVSVEYSANDIIELEQIINTILNDIITASMSEYDKILAVHDYVINNANYDSTCSGDIELCDNDHTAIGIFIDELAVCEGYAHAIDIMLRALDIPTFKISSSTHQWNVVLYDGTWYHLDATWDDPVVNRGPAQLLHDYFLVTTEELNLLDETDAHTYSTKLISFLD